MLCNPPVHPLSSCSSPKDRLCTASVLSFILTLFFPLRSHFSARNHPDEPHLDSKATGVIPCLRQRMGSRAFIVQGCPCVPCRCRRSFTNNTNKSTVSQIIYSVPQMRFTWLAKPSRFHMVCETMKRFTWFVKPCEIRTIKPVKFFRVLTKPCEITDPYGSLRSDEGATVNRLGLLLDDQKRAPGRTSKFDLNRSRPRFFSFARFIGSID